VTSEALAEHAAPPYALVIAPAQIGGGKLRQHALRALDDGRTLLLAMALGPPRLWEYLTRSALDGFVSGFERPHDGRASTRLHQGLLVAQQVVRERAESLIERRLPDVGLLALTLEGELLHVLRVGPLRAYVHRRTTVRCLGAMSDSPGGVLKNPPSWCAEPVSAGDLVFAASLSACGEPAIAAVRNVLNDRRATAPEEVVSLLSSAATGDGIACACLAFRVQVG
jgi:hypothetical protein